MRKLLFISLLLLPMLLHGQHRNIGLDWKRTDSLVYFKNAAYQNSTGQVPVYTEVIPWTDPDKIPVVTAKTGHSVPLDNKFKEQVRNEYLETSPQLSYQLVYEKKQPRLQMSYVPFYRDPETGRTMQVESFSREVSGEAPIARLKAATTGHFSATSRLTSGDWFKIGIKTSGMHKLTYEQILQAGVQNPALVKVFGAGAILLPEDFSLGSYDDLEEVPVYMYKGSDQLFGPGDYILFYAHGPVTWKYNSTDGFFQHELHRYATMGYYFLTDDMGGTTTPPEVALSSAVPDKVVTQYDILASHEDELYNLLKSGREWYGDNYDITLSGAYPFNLPGMNTSEPAKIRVAAAGRSNETSVISVKANNTTLGNISFNPVNNSSYTSTFAVNGTGTYDFNASESFFTLQVEYLQPNTNSEAWLNYITVNARAALSMQDNELTFRDSRSVSFGATTEFRVANAQSGMQVWEITDPEKPGKIPYSLNGSTASFKLETSGLREFIAFNPTGNFPSPQVTGPGLGRVPNQNLHGTPAPDMLIIYAEEFGEQANRLAEHRRSNDNLTVTVVTQEMIYNEFSSGTPNVSAIRNYLKMYYDTQTEGQMTKYLLLFGDGSYDNRDTVAGNPNLIMTYQSANSLVPTSSFVSDDFFGLLDTGEKLYDGLLDIGIGRLPVSTLEEAEIQVDKIIAYDSNETLGEWRNYLCFIADDEDGNIHMRQANNLAAYIEERYPEYNVNKIFMDAFPQETTPTGDRYPDVTRAINDQMNRGALVVNYTGHGGVTGLAHEKIVDMNNIKSWRNDGKLPLFMTATCEFSRYDEYDVSGKSEITSAGEEVLLNPAGGSIALFTTTRLVYSGPNFTLNERFYEIVFDKKENGDCYRLGDIIVYSKNNVGAGVNKRNFTLLGDPSLSLAFPRDLVITDSINRVALETFQDTISALDFVTVSGHLEDQSGNMLSNFSGSVIPIVYDKKSNLKTLANDGGSPMEFQSRNSILYKGNATVENGRFNFSFYVPKDIGYYFGDGKISYYGYSEDKDAHGASSGFTIGGLGDFSDLDTIGPEIRVYMNDSLFKNGGIVTDSPELLVYVNDPYGINTTGNGIGHDITSTLNNDRFNAIILNQYYQADPNSYSSGTVRYPYSDLPEGKHSIKVKVWDIFNNSASERVDFVVVQSSEMLLENIYTYPNPFIDQTFFNIEHNRPGQELEVIIRIYDLNGSLVGVIQQMVYSGGYRIEPPTWQGKSLGGATLGGGIYVYRVLVRSEQGEEAAGAGRLIIKR
jgi:hypothetical protein